MASLRICGQGTYSKLFQNSASLYIMYNQSRNLYRNNNLTLKINFFYIFQSDDLHYYTDFKIIHFQSKMKNHQSQEDINNFNNILKTKHYSVALVQFLLQKLEKTQVKTFQEINDIIKNDTDQIINYFIQNPSAQNLIEKKNPLCIEAIRDYLYRLLTGVQKKCGHDLPLFIKCLKETFVSQISVIKNSTSQAADVAYHFMLDHSYSKFMVYNYSKSVAMLLKNLYKRLGNNMQVYTCQSSFIGEGKKMFSQLSLEGINCTYIADAEVTYYVNEVDCVLTGAQVVLSDGSILNRTGTFMLALCAEQARKPMICLAESYKFINKVFLTQRDIPNHMEIDPTRKQPLVITDLTYSKHLRLFCTNIGCLNPDSVSFRLANNFR